MSCNSEGKGNMENDWIHKYYNTLIYAQYHPKKLNCIVGTHYEGRNSSFPMLEVST